MTDDRFRWGKDYPDPEVPPPWDDEPVKEHDREHDRAKSRAKEPPAGLGRPTPDRLMLRGVLADAVAVLAPTTEADWVGINVCLLAYTSVACGYGPHLTIGHTPHPLLVWPLLAGTTGTGRKGEANAAARAVMQAADAPFLDDHVVSGLSTGEGIIHRLRDGTGPDDEGTSDKRLVAEEPEFASVLARARREGSTLAMVLRDGWEGRTLQTLTRKEPMKASGPHMAVIGHITPRELRMRLADADLAGGTYNRFLLVFVERTKKLSIPPEVDPADLNRVAIALRRPIDEARQRRRRIGLTDDAEIVWETIYAELTDSDDDETAADEFTRRAAPYCRRIAALHAVLDGRDTVNAGDMDAAAALVRYSVASARYVLGGQIRDPRLDRIRRAVIEAGPDGITRADISGLFGRNLPSAVLDVLCTELLTLTEPDFETFTVATGGRPAEVYRCRL